MYVQLAIFLQTIKLSFTLYIFSLHTYAAQFYALFVGTRRV